MLEVKNLCVSYGDTEIIHNISFTIPKGNNLVVLGPNGCGKTTLLRAIAGLLTFQGEIIYNGEKLNDLTIKDKSKKIAFMSQFSFAEFDYTVKQTVSMGRYPHQKSGLFGGSSKEDEKIVENCIAIAGLNGIENSSVKKLSGGQLQRVFFARTLAQCPNIILLDEPTNHLDLKHQAELLDHIINWSKTPNHMAVGVLHDINQGLRFGDYGILLKDGNIVSQGILSDIITKELLEEVYEMDIYGYMLESLKRWEMIKHE